MRRLSLIALLATALAAPLAAQQGQQPPPPPQAQQPATVPPGQQPPPTRGGRGQTSQPPPTMPAGQRGRGGVPGGVPGRREPTTQNIRLEVTIMDSAEKTTRKVVTMLVRDRESGRIRSSNPNGGVLNVDGQSEVVADDRIAVYLTIEYQPERSVNMSMLNQSISVLLVPGKPTIISQSADPNTDRKVSVEVTATVVK